MSRMRRVIHHAGWFALLGPFFGLVAMITWFTLLSGEFFRIIVSVLPLILLWAWAFGAIPALATGIIVAFLPESIHASHVLRSIASVAAGAAVIVIYELIPHPLRLHVLLSDESLWIGIFAGAFSGLVMGWLVTFLPPCYQHRTPID